MRVLIVYPVWLASMAVRSSQRPVIRAPGCQWPRSQAMRAFAFAVCTVAVSLFVPRSFAKAEVIGARHSSVADAGTAPRALAIVPAGLWVADLLRAGVAFRHVPGVACQFEALLQGDITWKGWWGHEVDALAM